MKNIVKLMTEDKKGFENYFYQSTEALYYLEAQFEQLGSENNLESFRNLIESAENLLEMVFYGVDNNVVTEAKNKINKVLSLLTIMSKSKAKPKTAGLYHQDLEATFETLYNFHTEINRAYAEIYGKEYKCSGDFEDFLLPSTKPKGLKDK